MLGNVLWRLYLYEYFEKYSSLREFIPFNRAFCLFG